MANISSFHCGYDYKFITHVPEDYCCNICTLALRKPVQTKCGHRFCKDCLHESYDKCPVDGVDINHHEVFEDKATERRMMSFQVKCSNQGCDWQGQLKCVETHNNECLLTIVPCSYKTFGCDFKGQRIYLSEHIISKHLAFTTDFLLTLQEENKNLKNKLETMKQDQLVINEELNAVREENKHLKEQISTLETSYMIREENSKFSYIFKVDDIHKQLRTAKQDDSFVRMYSEPFYTHKYGYRLKLEVNPNGCKAGKGTHVSVFLHILRGEYDAILTWPFEWKIRFILLDQKPNQKKNIKMSFPRKSSDYDNFKRPTTDQNVGRGLATFVSHETLSTEHYVVNGKLFIQLELERA